MALLQKQDELIDETSKLEVVDEKSEVSSQDVDQEDSKERNEDDNGEEHEQKEEKEDDDGDDEGEAAENTCCLKIPIFLSIDKGNSENIRDNAKNVKEDITERGIDIVNIPKLPPLPQEPEISKRPPSRQSAKPYCHSGHSPSPCCGYMNSYCPRPLGRYQGIGHSGFVPFVMSSLGFPVVMVPAFSPMGIYSSTMPQICCAEAMGYRSMGSYPNNCCNLENVSHMQPCPTEEKHLNHHHGNYHHDDHHHRDHHHGNYHHDDHHHPDHHHGNYHHDDHHHPDHHHHHHHGEDQHYNVDNCDEKKPHHHHHHHQNGLDDEDRECEELEKCCIQHDDNNDDEDDDDNDDNGNDDETKSVEDLLEEYLEDIDEKTERIHELLDECEAMDLFINVHGFELDEIHVTACGRTVTVKGDHQYSEATWVRVRNFSEGYEIPEEFDISRTTATKTGDTLRIRIPHVDGE
ncbi:protein disconnected-like [Saccostrea echinata]|uniref:protein disconnected-like n=1 Tax=Saccostrea echinata TaxID=191078 RepID=UPI002A83D216|nr:protein disconnected-like [Saccostrea echinata]